MSASAASGHATDAAEHRQSIAEHMPLYVIIYLLFVCLQAGALSLASQHLHRCLNRECNSSTRDVTY
jgi:hypothetical protein